MRLTSPQSSLFLLVRFPSSALFRVCSTCVSQHAPLPAHLPVLSFYLFCFPEYCFLFICSVWVSSHLCLPASHAACLPICMSVCPPDCFTVWLFYLGALPACASPSLSYFSLFVISRGCRSHLCLPAPPSSSPVCLRVYMPISQPVRSVHLLCLKTASSTFPTSLRPLIPAPHPPTPASTHAVPNIRTSGELPAEARLGTTSPGSLRGCGGRGRRRGAGLDGRRLTAVQFEPSSRRAGAAQLGPSATRRSGRPRQCPGASHAEPRPRAVAAGDEREEPK